MQINTATLTLKTDKPVNETPTKLRGYIGSQFKENILLHNHYDHEIYLYTYPLVQYGIIEGQPYLFGLEEGVDVITQISSKIKELQLNKTYTITEKLLHEKTYDINTTPQKYKYKIIKPWLALNTKNYHKYKQITSQRDKKIFLNNILIGNILSMCKGLGIIINHRIKLSSYLNPVTIKYKSVLMTAFTGEFITNCNLPDHIGLGKGVSHGFGTIIRDQEYVDDNNL